MHGLDSVVPVLRRWGALSEQPMPQHWEGWASKNQTAAMEIQRRDPDLVLLLSGKANATLRASALQGDLSPCPPDIEEIEGAKIQARKQWLFENDPFKSGNQTQQLELYAIDPKLAEKLKAQATDPVEQDSLTSAQARRARAEEAEMRAASMNKSVQQAGAQYYRLKHLNAMRKYSH
jgi:hypothetical protein